MKEDFHLGDFQSEDETLDDIIRDLTLLRDERRIESSFQSAEL